MSTITFYKNDITKFETDEHIRMVDITDRLESSILQGIILNKSNNSTISLTNTVFVHINNTYIQIAKQRDEQYKSRHEDSHDVGILLIRTFDNKIIYICENIFNEFLIK